MDAEINSMPLKVAAQPGAVPVLLMVRELDQGGVERDVTKIALNLDKTRFYPHVATFFAHGLRYEELQAAGTPLLTLPLRSMVSKSAMQSAALLRVYIKQHNIKLVHSYDASGILASVVCRAMRVPVITSQLSYREILDSRTQQLLRFSDRFASKILVNCEAMRRYMHEHEGVSNDRIELCYNGVDTGIFHPGDEPKPAELCGASVVIGTVCALRPEKNLPLLQQAFSRLDWKELNLKLVMVGSGPELPRLQQHAAALGIDEASVFIPAQKDVARWMRGIDIFVLPSLSEAFSNSLLEAMACGCCVIGSRVGGTPELTGENTRGLLFESRNAEDLTQKLETVINDPVLRRDLGAKASQHARGSLSIAVAAKRTAEIYGDLLASRTR